LGCPFTAFVCSFIPTDVGTFKKDFVIFKKSEKQELLVLEDMVQEKAAQREAGSPRWEEFAPVTLL